MAAVGVVLLMGVAVGLGVGQMSRQSSSPTSPGSVRVNPGMPPIDGRNPETDPLAPRMEEQQARSRNSERQKKLMADTDKLLLLATDLKQQVDKTNKDVLSVDVVKKAEEIEKLAKSVKERMKG
jgi:hypothetical protein